MKKKTSMTSTDISIILSEFKDKIQNYFIDNIYGLNDIIVIRVKGFSRFPDFPRQVSIVIEPGKRIHLTEYNRTFPTTPTDKILTFRKFIKKGKLIECSQHGSDRIVIFKIENLENKRKFSLYCEFFGKGNVVLVEHLEKEGEPFNRIIYGLWYKIMRDRRLLPGKEFIFPPIRGKSILDIIEDDLNSLTSEQLDNQIVKSLVKYFGSSGEVIEEILSIAGIDKKENGNSIIPSMNNQLLEGIRLFKEKMYSGPPITIYENEDDEFASKFLPFNFQSITWTKEETFKNFNLAADQFFSPREMLGASEVEKVQVNKINQLSKQLQKQEEHLIILKRDAEKKKEIGNKIYSHAHLLEELFSNIKTANKKGMDWEDISNRLEQGKKKGMASAKLVNKLDFRNKLLIAEIDGEELKLDFTETPYTIGRKYFDASKKAERKIIPAIESIKTTKNSLKDAQEIKDQAVIISKATSIKKRKKNWYEAYHWSRTTNGFLIIAGRNLKENERLAKKRLETGDLFFHADVQGAPYTILKNSENDTDKDEQEPESIDLLDTASIAGIYSKGWKAGLGSVDVYSVSPDQVSFSAPSGEYLPKGGIFVEGKRVYYKPVLKIYIGVYFDDVYSYLFVSGNENVAKERTVVYTSLNAPTHSGEKKSVLAKKVQLYFEKKVPEEFVPKLKTLSVNDYVLYIP